MPTTILWFRQDLRLADNPALNEAVARGRVVPIYILDDETPGPWAIGGAGRWWLNESLVHLDQGLRALGSRLFVYRGRPRDVIERVMAAAEADGCVWNRCYEPFAVTRDQELKRHLKARGHRVWSCNGSLLFEPWEIATKGGDPYKVYTPYSKACLQARAPRRPVPPPGRVDGPLELDGAPADALHLISADASWIAGLREDWDPGFAYAHKRLEVLLEAIIEDYAAQRNRPDVDGTSRLSPRLHWGELSPNEVWHAVMDACGGAAALDPGSTSEAFLKELLWREFGYHILYHFPHLPEAPLKPSFKAFPWADDRGHRNAWRFGRTGYPIVDAGMRQLRQTGWMHNRVRMIVGSFLVKDLLEDWRHGAAWFWDNLVDADLASNTLGWQWVGGCGPDAAPYFRIFNPVKQGERFDPHGDYVRQWVPELEAVPDDVLHAPWQAPEDVLRGAGVLIGDTYPAPIVDHGHARTRALDALERIKQSA